MFVACARRATRRTKNSSQQLCRGIRIIRRGEGDIWLQTLNGPMFALSNYLDECTGRRVRDWPHEFDKGVLVKVNRVFFFYIKFCSWP